MAEELLPNPAGADAPSNPYGFSAEEQAAFDGNRAATPEAPVVETPPPAPAAAQADPAAPPAPAADGSTPPDPAAAAQAGVPGPEDDDDDVDDVTPPAIDPKTGKAFRKRVNYNKYRRTLERAQAAEGRVNELAANMARLDERLNIFASVLNDTPEQKKADADADPRPDPEQDIFATMAWQDRQINKLTQRLADREQRETQSTQVQQAEQEFKTAYVADVKRFHAVTPNFPQAYRHLIDTREKQLRALGYDRPAIERIVQNEERTVALRAYEAGKNPAEMLYAVALSFGFDPTKTVTPPANGGAGAPAAGGAPAAAPAQVPAAGAAPANGVVPPRVNVADQIRSVQTTLPSTTSLSGGAGAAPPALTPEYMNSLSQAEFGRIYDSLTPEQQRAALGG